MRRTLARIAAVAVLTLVGVGVAATPTFATTDPPGGNVCTFSSIRVTPHMYVSSMKMVATVGNDGDCGIQAFIHCEHVIGGTDYHYGSVVVTGETSTAVCPTNQRLYGNSGWRWFDGSNWHNVNVFTA
jgi:hypothetical protein